MILAIQMGQIRINKKLIKFLLITFAVILYFRCLYKLFSNVQEVGLGWKLPQERNPNYNLEQHGNYFILHNMLRPKRQYFGNQSITLVTHGTYQDLYHLKGLMLRWQAPLSITLFANGHDFNATMLAINYILHCTKYDILFHELVNIHLCIHHQHLPTSFTNFQDLLSNKSCNCLAEPSSMRHASPKVTYWHKQNLTYPYNLMRNVARMHAHTYYVFAMDLGWYPVVNFVPQFLQMIQKERLSKPYKSIFCFPNKVTVKNLAEMPFTQADLLSYFFKYIYQFGVTSASRRYAIVQKINGHVRIEKVELDNQACKSEFIMVNSKQPFFDEELYSEIKMVCGKFNTHKIKLEFKILDKLNYNYVYLSGTALLREPNEIVYSRPDYLRRITNRKPNNQTYPEALRRWQSLYAN